MEAIKKRKDDYNEGLISANEFLGFMIQEIGKIWQGNDSESPEATELANWFSSHL